MDKKAQATSWSLKELGSLLLRVFAIILLLYILVGIISIFTKPQPIANSYQDLDRVVGELQDLNQGEIIKVPVLSRDHRVFIVNLDEETERAYSCKLDEGNYCACLQSLRGNEPVLKCRAFEKDSEIISASVTLNPVSGVELNYEGDVITISQG